MNNKKVMKNFSAVFKGNLFVGIKNILIILFFIVIITIGMFLALFHKTTHFNPSPIKNIVIILIDTLRADHLSAYGYKRNTSPHIDNFAKKSLVFEKAFTAASYTLPAHVSLFTGVYPITHKMDLHYNEDRSSYEKPDLDYEKPDLDTNIKTMAEYFSSLGWSTVWATSPGNQYLTFNDPESRGFQINIPGNIEFDFTFNTFKDVLDKHSQKPFFAFLHTNYPHHPYYKKTFKKFISPDYKGKIITDEKDVLKILHKKYSKNMITVPRIHWREMAKIWWSFVNKKDPKDIQRLKDLYDDAILYTDSVVYRWLQLFSEKKLYENTIIIITSDHGEAFGEHGNFFHDDLHKEILHVPLMIYIPGISHRRIKAPVSLIDIYPTLLDLLEKKPPHKITGNSLLPLINGKKQKVHNYIFGQFYKHTSISDGKWKLIRLSNGDHKLYHVVKDFEEKKDISEKHPDILKKLNHQISLFLEQK